MSGDEEGASVGTGIRTCHSLEFDTWWTEGNSKRYVYIKYSIVDGTFQISIDEDNNLYHIPVVYNQKTGDAITVWYLYVGAEIDVLGRITTLQHCSQMTAQWNTYWSERLKPVRERLVEELRKYEFKKMEPWLTFDRKDPNIGAINLRMLILRSMSFRDGSRSIARDSQRNSPCRWKCMRSRACTLKRSLIESSLQRR